MKLLLVLLVALCARAQDKVNPASLVLKDFEQRVAEYVKLRKAAAAKVPNLKPTKTAQDIQHHEGALAHEIREARRGAVQGAIFTPEIAEQFRALIAGAMKGRDANRIQESLKQAAPVWLNSLQVNTSYPQDVPLQSSPPSLLANLPKLPPDLEYRLVAHALILRDVEANLIVDFLRNAIP